MNIVENFCLKNYNTFKIDVKTNYFVEIWSEFDIINLCQNDIFNKKKFFIWLGSNLLFTKDFDWLIIKNNIFGKKIIKTDWDVVYISIWAGEKRKDLVSWSVANNFAWFENLTDIPSSVWASVVQNIWAYWVEVWNLVDSVIVWDIQKKEKIKLTSSECHFGYRQSIFKSNPDLIVLYVIYKLQDLQQNPKYQTNIWYKDIQLYFENQDQEKITIQNIHRAISKIRSSKLPDIDLLWSAWSFFKNPIISKKEFEILKKTNPDIIWNETEKWIKLFAWWLIEKTVWKWFRFRNVWTYSQNALAIVTYWDIKWFQVLEFTDMIKKKVFEKFQIIIEEEVVLVK